MRVFNSINAYQNTGPVVLSIGNFDGLHRGHQHLLQENIQLANTRNGRSVVLSFSPHPMSIFSPSHFCTLNDQLDQQRGFESLGIDDWIIEPFSAFTRNEEPEAFFKRLLTYVPVVAIVVGPDFCFGKDRKGNVGLLKELGRQHQIEIILPSIYEFLNQKVSSSQIRALLKQGDVERAAELLGRPFSLSGIVLHGFGRGRKIGIPTANIISAQVKNLRTGVYCTRVHVDGRTFKSATNVGIHPTFGEDQEVQIESHLIDFDEVLYGETIRVDFLKFIRAEKKFTDIDSLKAQIAKDIKIARET